jgi:hypothetical protein
VEIGLQRTTFALRVLEVVLEDFVYLLGLLQPGLQLPLADAGLVRFRLDARADLPELALCGLRSLARKRKLFPEVLRLGFDALSVLSFPRQLGSRLHEGLLHGVRLRGKQRELGCEVLLRHSSWFSAPDSIPLPAIAVSPPAYDRAMADGERETPEERRNRELIELLNELRVALPGVQVLFAFLLAIPFANGFPKLSELDRDVYFVALVATMVSTALLITPSAYHRFVFRQHDKEQLLETSNRLTIAGLGALAVAMTCSVFVIADFIFKWPMTIIVTILTPVLFGFFWYALPLGRRAQLERRER